jgi:class 3 adenylate cyclase
MDQPSNKTIMCSVFFLDIVGYSKRSVAGQISLKERFNSYLSAAIRDVPLSDRIILDTGDGAAINFMGDVEDALKAALSMRSSMLLEDPDLEPPLLVRMGINLGPVRLIRDINGQPNIVGDGINVAQRVMGFADASQILVSRSYFDAVSRLSPQYAGMFHYQGSRTDKHVREHEVYAIGYPGDKTTRPFAVQDGADNQPKKWAKISAPIVATWNHVLKKLDAWLEFVLDHYQHIEPKKRPLYVAVIGVPLVLLIAFGLKSALRNEEIPVKPKPFVARVPRVMLAGSGVLATSISPASAVSGVPVTVDAKTGAVVPAKTAKTRDRRLPSATPVRTNPVKSNTSSVVKKTVQMTEQEKAQQATNHAVSKVFGFAKGGDAVNNAKISLSCLQGTLLFVDGTQKGSVTTGGDAVAEVTPGRHVVIAILPSQKLFNQTVDVPAGKMVRIRPSSCN